MNKFEDLNACTVMHIQDNCLVDSVLFVGADTKEVAERAGRCFCNWCREIISVSEAEEPDENFSASLEDGFWESLGSCIVISWPAAYVQGDTIPGLLDRFKAKETSL